MYLNAYFLGLRAVCCIPGKSSLYARVSSTFNSTIEHICTHLSAVRIANLVSTAINASRLQVVGRHFCYRVSVSTASFLKRDSTSNTPAFPSS